MALDFPASPNINDTYTFGGVTWTWDGTTWKVLGRFQFTSSETDPVFSASPSANILQSNINNWNTAYGWGDHSSAGYLTSVGSIGSHSDVTIATLQDGQLLKYSVGNAKWENWTPNYLTSYTETDPIFQASAAGGITGTNIANWNTAYNWGDHGSAGYLTAESDTLATVTGRGATTTTDITTTGKIYYSNNFADLTALNAVNPTTYHGMFAHVHAEGHGYFAHAGAWTQLLDTGSSLSEIADVSASTPSTNDVLTWNGTAWAPAAAQGGGGGGANVTISDTIPAGSPSAGDLWWESDSGRLKVYYTDVDSSQWVDASPPLADATTIGASGTVSMKAHIIPDTDATHDIGSAEYKVRHLFLSDNSMWLGNRTRMSVGFRNNNDAQLGARPTVRFYNRNVNQTPRPIAQAGGTVSGCIAWVNSTFPGRSGPVNASTLLLTDWTGYWSSLTGAPIGTYGVDDLYPPQFLDGDINPAYFGADWADAMGFSQNGQERAVTVTSDSGVYDLAESDTFIRVNANADFPVNIGSVSTDNDTFFNMTVWVSQGVTPYAINAVGLDNGSGGFTAATQVKSKGTALANNVQAFKITGVKISGNWSVNIDIG